VLKLAKLSLNNKFTVDATKTSFITLTFKPITSSQQVLISSWVYGKEKIRGGRKEICPTFSDCARVVKKNFLESGGGGVIMSDYEFDGGEE
jgi:hypothetical protein